MYPFEDPQEDLNTLVKISKMIIIGIIVTTFIILLSFL